MKPANRLAKTSASPKRSAACSEKAPGCRLLLAAEVLVAAGAPKKPVPPAVSVAPLPVALAAPPEPVAEPVAVAVAVPEASLLVALMRVGFDAPHCRALQPVTQPGLPAQAAAHCWFAVVHS